MSTTDRPVDRPEGAPRVAPSRARAFVRRLLLTVATASGVVLAGAAGTYGWVQYGGNLHAVEAGQVYRAAQPSGAQIHRVVHDLGIKSVLNLRGPNAGKPWYDEEMQASGDEHLVHFDIALSAQHDLTPEQMQRVLQVLRDAPKPLLIHCNAGSDRTGLASALYLLSKGTPPATAREQLALRFGHFPYLGSASVAMDRTFDAYVTGTLVPTSGDALSLPASAPTR